MLLIIDGNNILYSSIYTSGINEDNYENKDLQILIVNNFFMKINSIIKNFNILNIILCWDSPSGSSYRKSIYPLYKSNRKKSNLKTIVFKDLVPLIKEGLNLYPLMQIEHELGEGDDVIFSLCDIYREEKDITIMSCDNDFKQLLLLYENVRIYNHTKKQFLEKPNENFLKEKCLIGDTSDKITGIRRIGKKTAPLYISGEKQLNEEQLLEYEKIMSIVDLNQYIYKDKIKEDIIKLLQNKKNTWNPNELDYFFVMNGLNNLEEKFYIIKSVINSYLRGE